MAQTLILEETSPHCRSCGSPHMHINRPDGSKDTRYIRGLDMRESLTHALNVIGEHWELYRDQYERGLRK